MAYAQTSYPQQLGAGPYSIADAGCFLTAFCNLLNRFNLPIDPPTLNNYFKQHGTYIDVDDGKLDDLAWGSISSYDASVVPAAIGGAGWPSSNDAIVKFVYQSVKNPYVYINGVKKPNMITHFCLVVNAATATILDSYDGLVKRSPYGTPVASARYERHAAQPVVAYSPPPAVVAAPAPAPAPAPSSGYAPGKKLFLPAEAGTWRVYRKSGPWTTGHEIGKLWPGNPQWRPGLTFDVLGVIATNVYEINTETWGKVAIYAGPDTIAQWVDTPPAPPAPQLTASKPATDVVPVAPAPAPVPVKAPEAAPAPAPVPTPPPAKVDTEPVASTAPVDWQATYQRFNQPAQYVSTRQQTVQDLSGKQPDMVLPKYDPGAMPEIGVVRIYGTVMKDGQKYYRAKTNNDPNFDFWYCIPMVDKESGTANLLVMPPTPAQPVSVLDVAGDAVALARAHLKQDIPKFLDDIMPKWLHKTKK